MCRYSLYYEAASAMQIYKVSSTRLMNCRGSLVSGRKVSGISLWFLPFVRWWRKRVIAARGVQTVLPNPQFRRPIGLLLTFAPRPAKPCRYFATLGYFLLPGREMSLNRASLWKIVNFLSIQRDFEPFQRQWADLSSIDRIKTSYGAMVGDYPQLPELDNLSFSAQLRDFWLICHIKAPKMRQLGAF